MSIAVFSVLLATPVAHAQPQSPAQEKCLSVLSKRVANLVKAQGKEIDACVVGLADGVGNSFSCLTVDAKGGVAKAATKLVDSESTACTEVPDFGYVGSSALIHAATAHRIALVNSTTSIYEQELSSAFCTRLFLKGAAKLLGRKLRGFTDCVEKGLPDASIQSSADLVGCFSAFDSSTDARLSKLLSSLASRLDNHQCYTSRCYDGHETCADRTTTCHACQMLRIGEGLAVDCDLLDNGMADGSCTTTCGDGEVGAQESCDDGNLWSGDGCDSNCKPSGCGNGLPSGDELCEFTYGSDLGGVCVGGLSDGAACSYNAECDGGYCTSCPWRASCAADCGSCQVPYCVWSQAGCYMLEGSCIGQLCVLIPTLPCDDPVCGTAGNCTIDGYCVPTPPETCAEYEGVPGSCTLGM